MLRADPAEVLRSIKALYQPGMVVEVRVPKTRQGTVSGYYDDHDKLARDLVEFNGEYVGIYTTLNPCQPALLARSKNHIKPRATVTTSDPDILTRCWLLIDCDPKRPAEISSTDGEHEAAIERARQIRMVLAEEGWPAPILADSGNGAHLLYRIDLPNDEATTKLLERVLKVLAARFDDDAVKIDQAVFNAARICKAYGTITRKGDDIPERPHRRSHLLDKPYSPETVERNLLEQMVARMAPAPAPAPRSQPRTGYYEPYDLDGFIDRYLKARAPVEHEGGRKWVLDECPFNPEHRAPDSAIFEQPGGRIGFKCMHNSCANYHWQDVRALYDPPKPRPERQGWQPSDVDVPPEYRALRESNGNGAQAAAPVTEAEAPPERTKAKTKVVYTYADVPNIFDFEVKAMSYIIPDILPEGCIVLFTGDSGHGKSMLATAMAGAIAHGGVFLGRQCVQRPVLYLDRENPVGVAKQHLYDLKIRRTPNLTVWGEWCEQQADGPASVSLLEYAKAAKPVFIFDSLIAFHSGDEQDASETRRYLHRYRQLAAAGATIILLHHVGKGEGAKQYRGSSDIKASCDVAWLMEKLGDPAGLLAEVRLVPFKNRIGESKQMALSFRDGEFHTSDRPESNQEIFERIVRNNPFLSGSQLVKLGSMAGLGKTRIEQFLLDGVRDGWLQIKAGKGTSKLYALAEPLLEL